MITSFADGVGKSDTPSTRAPSSATKPPSFSRSSPSSYPLEILTLKWVSPTGQEGAELRRLLMSLLQGLQKQTSPEFPGWVVVHNVYASPTGTTTRLVFHVEPETLPF